MVDNDAVIMLPLFLMKGQDLQNFNLPDTPGVYFFKEKIAGGKGDEEKILYIGRATSLRDRVRSYFSHDLIATRGPLIVDMVTKATKIDFEESDSVLEAIILESNLIKEHQPYYNTKEKDNRSYVYVIVTDEEFPRIILVRERTLEMQKEMPYKIRKKFGPFPQGALLRDALKIIRKIFPFRDEKSKNAHYEAFYRSLGLAPDTSSPEARKRYAATIRHITLFFEGKKAELIKMLEKEMREAADDKKFEEAGRIKKTLYALLHIQDVALIKSDRNEMRTVQSFRIEAYDIAHLSGKNTVGVMTVVTDGEKDSSQYRKFRIRSVKGNDDVGNLLEVLARRFTHGEWPAPQLIVIDGGAGQLNAAQDFLLKNNLAIPIVSVVKDDTHKARDIMGDTVLGEAHKASILLANSEVHRYALAYHRRLRNNLV